MEYYEFKKEDAYEFVRVSGIQSKQRGDELQLPVRAVADR